MFDSQSDGDGLQKPDNSADIKVGTLIALMVEEGDDWQNVEVPGEASGAPTPTAAATPPPAAAVSTGTIRKMALSLALA